MLQSMGSQSQRRLSPELKREQEGIPWWFSVVREFLVVGLPGLGRSPGGGHGNPLQYPCLENPHGEGSLAGYSPGAHKQSDTTE